MNRNQSWFCVVWILNVFAFSIAWDNINNKVAVAAGIAMVAVLYALLAIFKPWKGDDKW